MWRKLPSRILPRKKEQKNERTLRKLSISGCASHLDRQVVDLYSVPSHGKAFALQRDAPADAGAYDSKLAVEPAESAGKAETDPQDRLSGEPSESRILSDPHSRGFSANPLSVCCFPAISRSDMTAGGADFFLAVGGNLGQYLCPDRAVPCEAAAIVPPASERNAASSTH